ncbi:MAG: TetR/AcrR family transcriptional regulator [Betaproteobacteria bacterium]
MTLIWAKGVHRCGMRALMQAMDMGASSVALAFGTKGELLVRVAQRYRAAVSDAVLAALEAADGRAALERFVRAHAEWLSAGQGGCLLLSLAQEHELDARVRRVAQQHVDALRGGLMRALERAYGTTRHEIMHERMSLTLLMVFGLAAASRGGATQKSMEAMAEAVIGQIRHWR